MVEHIFRCENYSRSLTRGIEDMCALMPADWYGTIHEEIVRCRDCTHFMTWANGYSFCSQFSIGATGDPFPGEPDGFCAWGVRREP